MSNVSYLIEKIRELYGESRYSDESILKMINATINQDTSGKYYTYSTAYVIPEEDSIEGIILYRFKEGAAHIPQPSQYDIIRNPYAVFTQEPPPIIEIADEQYIIYKTVYNLRVSEITSDSRAIQTWKAGDITVTRSTTRSAELLRLLQADMDRLKPFESVNPKIVIVRKAYG